MQEKAAQYARAGIQLPPSPADAPDKDLEVVGINHKKMGSELGPNDLYYGFSILKMRVL